MKKSYLSKNIAFLRKQNHETQKELGEKIGVRDSTISNYETEIREPSNDILTKLSEHYLVSVNDLLYKDLSQYIYGILPNNSDEIYNSLRIEFPFVCSEKALSNKNFKIAYRKTCEIFESLKSPFNILTSAFIEKGIQEYKIAFQEDDTLFESIVNILCLIFLHYSAIVGQNENIKRIGFAMYNGEVKHKNFRKQYFTDVQNNIDKDIENSRKSFIEVVDSDVYELFYILKSTRYADIADYYIALKYLLNFIDDENDPLINAQVGNQLMYTYARIGNSYAIKFLEHFLKINE